MLTVIVIIGILIIVDTMWKKIREIAIDKHPIEEIKIQLIGQDDIGVECYKCSEDNFIYRQDSSGMWHKGDKERTYSLKRYEKVIIIEGILNSPSWNKEIETKKTQTVKRKAQLKVNSQKLQHYKDNNIAYCPKCFSEQVSIQKKGFSVGKAIVGGALLGGVGLVGGAVGANKMELVCLKCGNQFKFSK